MDYLKILTSLMAKFWPKINNTTICLFLVWVVLISIFDPVQIMPILKLYNDKTTTKNGNTCLGPISRSNSSVWKWFVLDKGTSYHITMCTFFVLRTVTWSYKYLLGLFLLITCSHIITCKLELDRNTWNHITVIIIIARISLTLSRHFSLSFIASGRSSGLHPVSSHCCMYVLAGCPVFARLYVGVHRI